MNPTPLSLSVTQDTMKNLLSPLLCCIIGAATLLTTGCMQSKDHLRLNADGSGRWTYRVTLGPQLAAALAGGESVGGGPETMTVAGVKAAAKQTKGITLKTCEEKREGNSQTLTVDLTFDSIAELANSPFAEQLGWELKSEKGQLVVYSPGGPFGDEDDDNVNFGFSGMKPFLIGLKLDRIVTLPNPITSTNAHAKKAAAAKWGFAVDADTSEAEMKKMSGMRPRVACAMKGVTMKLPVKLKKAEKTADASFDFGGGAGGQEHAPTPASKSAKGIVLQPIHAVVHREQHYVPTNILSMSDPLKLTFSCTWPSVISPAGYSSITVEKARDNKGTDLVRKEEHSFHKPNELRDLRVDSDKKNTARMEVNLGAPARDATAFSASGYLNLHVPKRVVPVKIRNPEKYVGKQLQGKELAPLAVTLKSYTNNRVALTSKSDLDAIQEIRVESADGSSRSESWSSNRSSFGDRYEKSVHLRNDREIQDPVLVLVVAEGIEKQRVDFKFNNLKLP